MEELLYGVALDFAKEYAGRDPHGRIKFTIPGAGRLMTCDCAEKLVERLKNIKITVDENGKKVDKPQFPFVRVVTNFRGERDEIVATSLADLGEDHVGTLERSIRLALSNGVSREEVLEALHCEWSHYRHSSLQKSARVQPVTIT
jgi:hypothetical protein